MSLFARIPRQAAFRQVALRRTPASSRFLTSEQVSNSSAIRASYVRVKIERRVFVLVGALLLQEQACLRGQGRWLPYRRLLNPLCRRLLPAVCAGSSMHAPQADQRCSFHARSKSGGSS